LSQIFQPLLFLLARCCEHELRRQIEYLKAENELLRTRVPQQRIFLKPEERARLLKLGLALGPAIRHLITIIDYSTFRRWVRSAGAELPAARPVVLGSKLSSANWLCKSPRIPAGATAGFLGN
jgi:putative transposase